MMPSRPVRVAPSLLAADFARLGEETRAVAAAGADWLHLDIMDGHFVPNISFGPVVVKALRKHAGIPFDVHLMIAPADPHLEAFRAAGADWISVHPEAGPHLHRTLRRIRELGAKAGVVFNPGFGGQSFITSQLRKVERLRQMIDASGRDIVLEVDGGVTAQTAPQCIAAGATALVAGSAVFKGGQGAYASNIAALRGG